jgi:hypothetical protein
MKSAHKVRFSQGVPLLQRGIVRNLLIYKLFNDDRTAWFRLLQCGFQAALPVV